MNLIIINKFKIYNPDKHLFNKNNEEQLPCKPKYLKHATKKQITKGQICKIIKQAIDWEIISIVVPE